MDTFTHLVLKYVYIYGAMIRRCPDGICTLLYLPKEEVGYARRAPSVMETGPAATVGQIGVAPVPQEQENQRSLAGTDGQVQRCFAAEIRHPFRVGPEPQEGFDRVSVTVGARLVKGLWWIVSTRRRRGVFSDHVYILIHAGIFLVVRQCIVYNNNVSCAFLFDLKHRISPITAAAVSLLSILIQRMSPFPFLKAPSCASVSRQTLVYPIPRQCLAPIIRS